MENILMALFGGGIADWQDISETKYDWEEIIRRARQDYEERYIDINVLYTTVLKIAREELQEAMENYEGETSEEFKKCTENIEEFFEIFANCLDTHLWFLGSEELGKEIQEKLQGKIDEIDEKIGFTYFSFN